ncbi:thioesterase [Nonomuraea sp. K274]|uniref:Thioesterase n=1 Tax=Nonomuraea cypriaca TaxID=1187855 RepID=A0A931EZ12_9ACTN|nr:alpha/beta fold hydrolase [Nonomuraea cypriaca]MBF8187072.1 thioesterase [Nonomuraea cypriaca]
MRRSDGLVGEPSGHESVTVNSSSSSWIRIPVPRPQARIRLFCLPHAGGGASSYTAWARGLPTHIEVCAAQLPGRETRIEEPAITDIHAMARTLADVMAAAADLPFAIFGHSMGAVIAYEVAQELLRRGGPQPLRLFASGARAPHLPLSGPRLADLPTDELIRGLAAIGGIPVELLDRREYLDLIVPSLRGDLIIAENHRTGVGAPLPYPITGLTGEDDIHVPLEQVREWERHTSAAFKALVFPGGHFFHRDHMDQVLAAVEGDISLDVALRLS